MASPTDWCKKYPQKPERVSHNVLGGPDVRMVGCGKIFGGLLLFRSLSSIGTGIRWERFLIEPCSGEWAIISGAPAKTVQ